MSGVSRITQERRQQVFKHSFDTAKDDSYTAEELVWAALHYAAPESDWEGVARVHEEYEQCVEEPLWPYSWDKKWDKKQSKTRIEQLSIAGALIAAEIDRLERLQDE